MAASDHSAYPPKEDKIVQGAVAEVLSAIYEVDFLGFSDGFRPRRNPHHALAAIHTAVMTQCRYWSQTGPGLNRR
jgi:RNA-directed DNA polymerase